MKKLRIKEAFTGNVPEWVKKNFHLTKQYGRTWSDFYLNDINFTPKSIPTTKKELLDIFDNNDNYVLYYMNPETGDEVVWKSHAYKYSAPYIKDPRNGKSKSILRMPFDVIAPYIQDFGILEIPTSFDIHYQRVKDAEKGVYMSKDDPGYELKSNIYFKKKNILFDLRRSLSIKYSQISDYCLSSRASDNITEEQRELGADLAQRLLDASKEITNITTKNNIDISYSGSFTPRDKLPYSGKSFEEIFNRIPYYKELLQEAEDFYDEIKNQPPKPRTYRLKSNKFYCDDYEIDDLFDMTEQQLRQAGWLRGSKVYIPKGTEFTLDGDDYYYEYIRIYGGPLDDVRLGFVPDGTLSRDYLLRYCDYIE